MKKVLFLLFALVISMALVGCSNSINEILKLIDNGDYDQAMEIYEKKIDDRESKNDLEDALIDKATVIYDDYNNNAISYEVAYRRITRITNFDIDETYPVWNIAASLEELHHSKEMYHSANENMDSGNYIDAYYGFLSVIHDDNNYQDAQNKSENAKEAYIDCILRQADEYVANYGDYKTAIKLLDDAEFADGSIENAYKTYKNAWEESVLKEADEAYQLGDYELACTILDESGISTETVNNKKQNYLYEWENAVIFKAKEAFENNKDYISAIRILQSFSADSDNIMSQIEMYNGYAPKSLVLEFVELNSKGVVVGGLGQEEIMDVNMKTYDEKLSICAYGGISLSSYAAVDDDGYISYYLNKEYSRFTAILYRTYASLSKKYDTQPVVKILGDGALLYESPTIDHNTYDPINIDIDITGVRELKIIIRGTVYSPNTGWPGLYNRDSGIVLAEIFVQK